MALNQLSNQQLCYPSAAANISLTSPGSAWGNSAYSEIVASVNSSVLAGFVVRVTTNDAVDVEVDIATGAAASEAVIATIRFGTQAQVFSNPALRLPIGIDNIPNNSRLSARVRISTTQTFTVLVSITLYDKPVPNSWLTTAQPTVALPPAGNSIVPVAGGGAWTNGSYTQLRTNSGAALVLLALVNSWPPTGAANYEVDVATGGAGSETVITTIPCYSESGGNGPGWSILANPLDNIAVNARVALRIRSNAASQQVRLAAMAIEKPL